jgi:hypothetical protein
MLIYYIYLFIHLFIYVLNLRLQFQFYSKLEDNYALGSSQGDQKFGEKSPNFWI